MYAGATDIPTPSNNGFGRLWEVQVEIRSEIFEVSTELTIDDNHFVQPDLSPIARPAQNYALAFWDESRPSASPGVKK
jgi:hypothetical protein